MTRKSVVPTFTIPQAEILLELAQEAEIEALGGAARQQLGARAMDRLIKALAKASSAQCPRNKRVGSYSCLGPGRSGGEGGDRGTSLLPPQPVPPRAAPAT